MGNYLFRPATLRAALADSLARGEHDFGRHVLPRLVHTHRVFAYDFGGNRVPGIRACEEPAYWRDVGTVDAYVQAHWDLLGPDPRFCLRNPQWPIRGAERPLMLEFGDGGAHVGSIAGPGALYEGASIRHSVLQRGAHVETGADVERCIVMDGARIGRKVRLRDAIVGCGNLLDQARRTRRPDWSRSPAGVMIIPPRALQGRI
jgi:glucose-1-phosphate adenylyltransferase